VSNEAREPYTRRKVLQAMQTLLSDDHNYEQGLASLRDLVDGVVRDRGTTGIGDLAVALSVELAGTLERIAHDEGLAATDLAEVWFAD
jgi:hypothetical protein